MDLIVSVWVIHFLPPTFILSFSVPFCFRIALCIHHVIVCLSIWSNTASFHYKVYLEFHVIIDVLGLKCTVWCAFYLFCYVLFLTLLSFWIKYFYSLLPPSFFFFNSVLSASQNLIFIWKYLFLFTFILKDSITGYRRCCSSMSHFFWWCQPLLVLSFPTCSHFSLATLASAFNSLSMIHV